MDPYAGLEKHKHYSKEVLAALRHFQDVYTMYIHILSKGIPIDDYRLNAVQESFNNLLKIRKEQTGYADYRGLAD